MSQTVAIITPAYKAQSTLTTTVRSVIEQTHADWQHWIVADDGFDYGALLHEQGLNDARQVFLTSGGVGRGASVTRNVALEQIDTPFAAVLDADALNLLTPALLESCDAPILLTPHEGELARLCEAFEVDGETKRERASALAIATGCAVLAKGADTLLAVGEELRFFTPATRWLSVAGSGDVLAGIAAARLAVTGDLMQAACEAVHLHGRAARIAGAGFTATMLAEAVRPALGQML